ncbi:MAG: septum formation protein Maf [Bacteroidetes bacterium]|nr:septum formation protein Maf [Bacteroidota bacterium]MBL6944323.1 septum formation protein Maf [Bacteroidales bacterium]
MLQNKLLKYEIILASASPRRKQLLEELGIKFRVQTKKVDENYPADFPVDKVAQYLSEIKAAAFQVSEMKNNTLIITADTIVALGNTILGKPSNHKQAFKILMSLSGKKHHVITGVTLRTIEKRHSFSVSTEVFFKNLSEDEINFYVSNYKPFDKAGAYGIQEWIGHVAIEKIEGSYFNVMGLPTHRLYEELNMFIDSGKGNRSTIILDI